MRKLIIFMALVLIGATVTAVIVHIETTISAFVVPPSGGIPAQAGTSNTPASGTLHAGIVPSAPARPLEDYAASLPRADLRGKITAPDGTPAAGAEVFLYYHSGEHGLRDRLAGQAQSAADGSYEFKGAYYWEPVHEFQDDPPPQFLVLAQHEKGGNFTVLLRGDSGDGVNLTLWWWRTNQEIAVVDEAGRPVAGARVYPGAMDLKSSEMPGPNKWRRMVRSLRDFGFLSAETNIVGCARLRNPGWGYVSFTIDKPGFVPANNHQFPQTFYADASRFSGRVTWPDGRPAAQVAITVRYLSGDRRGVGNYRSVLTDAQGQFDFPNMDCAKYIYEKTPTIRQPGPGTLQVRVGDLRPDSHCLDQYLDLPIKPGEWVRHDFKLERGVVLAGRLVDGQTSAPLPGVRIFHDAGHGYRCEPTDEAGRFRMVVPPGRDAVWRVESAQGGEYLVDRKVQPMDHWNTIPPGPGDREDLVLTTRLRKLRPLAGCVLAREPFNNCFLYVDNYLPEMTVDAGGRFEFPGVPAEGETEVLACARIQMPNRSWVDWFGLARVGRDQAETTITLSPGESYQGEVEDQEGNPVADFPFMLYPIVNGSPIYSHSANIKAGPDGSFTASIVPGLKYGARWATVWNDNATTQVDDGEVVLPIDEAGRTIYMMVQRFAHVLRGRVTGPRGEPVPFARLMSDKAPRPNHLGGNIDLRAGRDGTFIIANLDNTTFTLRASAEGYLLREAQGRAQDFLNLVLEPYPTGPRKYTFTVVDETSRPMANTSLRLQVVNRWTNQYSEPRELRTDAQGRASLTWGPPEGIPSTRFAGRLECDLPGYSLYYRAVQMCKDFEIRIPLHRQGAPYRGRVLNRQKEPLAGARVEVLTFKEGGSDTTDTAKQIWPAWFDQSHSLSVVTGRDGSFELPRFSPPDSISGRIRAEGYADEYFGFDAANRFNRRDQAVTTVMLQPGGAIRGRLQVEGGLGEVGRVEIGLRRMNGGAPMQNFTPVRPDGSFDFKGVLPGPYRFFLTTRDDWSSRTTVLSVLEEMTPLVTVEAGKTAEVSFKVEPSYKVRGRVVEAATGQIAETERIHLRANRDGKTIGSAEARPDGTWEMFLPAGEITLEITREARTNKPEQKRITVARGQPNQFTIQLGAGVP